MRAFCVLEPHRYGLADVPEPRPGAGEVLLRVGACGICGSDLDVLQGTRPASVTRYPATLGHEFSAEIQEVGAGVIGLAPGTKVAVDTLITCGQCFNCQQGWVCHCEKGYAQTGFTHPGGMAEYVVVKQSQLYPVSPDAELERIALAEPASCAAHGVLKAELKPGDTVIVIGAGPIGALAMQIANLFSPGKLVLVEVDPQKLGNAAALGATHAVDARNTDIAECIRDITGGRGADAVIECSGHGPALERAFGYAGTKGRIVAIGVPEEMTLPLDFLAMLTHDLTFRVSNGYTTQIWTWVLKLLAENRIHSEGILTHCLPLSRVISGFDLLLNRSEPVVKVMLDTHI